MAYTSSEEMAVGILAKRSKPKYTKCIELLGVTNAQTRPQSGYASIIRGEMLEHFMCYALK